MYFQKKQLLFSKKRNTTENHCCISFKIIEYIRLVSAIIAQDQEYQHDQ